MKKTIAIAVAAFAVIGSSFAQGYVAFSSSKSAIWDDFTSPGVGVVAPVNTYETFLWTTSSSLTTPWSTATATNATSSSATWSQITTAIGNGWNVATNNTSGNEVVGTDIASGVTKGAISYNGAVSFPLFASPSSGNIYAVVVAWSTNSGSVLPFSGPLGVSSIVTYAVGASSSSPVGTFSGGGFTPIGVAPTPEPATIALAGLGVSALVAFRRRSSK